MKCCSSHEQIQLILNLSTFNEKIKQCILFFEVNPASVLYPHKFQEKLKPLPQSKLKKIALALHDFAENFYLI